MTTTTTPATGESDAHYEARVLRMDRYLQMLRDAIDADTDLMAAGLPRFPAEVVDSWRHEVRTAGQLGRWPSDDGPGAPPPRVTVSPRDIEDRNVDRRNRALVGAIAADAAVMAADRRHAPAETVEAWRHRLTPPRGR